MSNNRKIPAPSAGTRAPSIPLPAVPRAGHVQAAIQACLQPKMPAAANVRPLAPHVQQAVGRVLQAKPDPAKGRMNLPQSAPANRISPSRSPVIQRMMEDTGSGKGKGGVNVEVNVQEQDPLESWPEEVTVRGKTWRRSVKMWYIVYESPDLVKTTEKFGKNKLRSHIRIDTKQHISKWDGSYHVTFYVRSDGMNCERLEDGDSLCLHTYYRCGQVTGNLDGEIETLNRMRFTWEINQISWDFWGDIERAMRGAVVRGDNQVHLLAPAIAYDAEFLGSFMVYYEVGPGVVQVIGPHLGNQNYMQVELKGCTIRRIVHGKAPEQRYVSNGVHVYMDHRLLR